MTRPDAKLAIVAIGGNSLISSAERRSVEDQYEAARNTCRPLAAMIADGWSIVVTHGNGPQVGFILRRSELASKELHEVPLDVCGADTQGAIGYMLQQNLQNELRLIGVRRDVVALITQIEVSTDDPAFLDPSKPIGSYMNETESDRRRLEGWVVREDAGRGWRRVVPSPRPLAVVEGEIIKRITAIGVIVIAAGGGGIPVIRTGSGGLRGVAAVVDKDLSASLLATYLDADLLLITTSVSEVALNYGQLNERPISQLSVGEARRLIATGEHFARGSMEPKVMACVEFIEAGGSQAIITSPGRIMEAISGRAGTRFSRESHG